MRPIKLLHLIVWLGIGGAERQLLTWLRHAPRERYDVTIGVLEGPPTLGQEFLAAGARRVVCFGMRGMADATVAARLYRHCHRERYTIVHTHGFRADVWGGWAARWAETPVVISTKHNEDQYLRQPLWRWVGRRTARMNDRVVAISSGVERFLHEVARLPADRMTRIRYGIEPATVDGVERQQFRAAWGISDAQPVIAVIGRLVPQKGHHIFLDAMARVLRDEPSARALIVGDGPLRRALEQQTKRLELDAAVQFLGWRRDVAQILAAADLIVLPSLWEGLGLVLLEAMTTGKPIVATRVGGIPEVVCDGVTGVLVPPADPSALASAILTLLRDPARRQAMGHAGQQWALAQFDVSAMVRQVDALYTETLAAKSGAIV